MYVHMYTCMHALFYEKDYFNAAASQKDICTYIHTHLCSKNAMLLHLNEGAMCVGIHTYIYIYTYTHRSMQQDYSNAAASQRGCMFRSTQPYSRAHSLPTHPRPRVPYAAHTALPAHIHEQHTSQMSAHKSPEYLQKEPLQIQGIFEIPYLSQESCVYC